MLNESAEAKLKDLAKTAAELGRVLNGNGVPDLAIAEALVVADRMIARLVKLRVSAAGDGPSKGAWDLRLLGPGESNHKEGGRLASGPGRNREGRKKSGRRLAQ